MTQRFFTSGNRLILSSSGYLSDDQWGAIMTTCGHLCELGWYWSLDRKDHVLTNPYLKSIPFREIAAPEQIDLSAPLPDGKILRKHQQEGVRVILEKRRLILADEMGLGKSITSLVSAQQLAKELEAFIVVIAPVTLHDMWRDLAIMIGCQDITEIFSWAKIRWPEKANFVLIADEAHYAQGGSSTQRGKAFKDITAAPNCVACILLTGTPLKNGRPSNLYPLLRAVKAPIARDKSYYDQHFCDAKRTKYSRWDCSGAINLDELREAAKPYILRRLKKNCLDLPKMTRVIVDAEVDSKHQLAYKEICKSAKVGWLESRKTGADAKGFLDKTYQSASLVKVPHAIELVESILEQGHKVVVFSQYLEPVHQVARAFPQSSLVLTGATPKHQRQGLVDRFQSDPEMKIWSSTTQAGGVGLTLTAACYVILIDRPWTPGDAEQCEARIDRDGQTLPCTSYWLRYGNVDEERDDKLAMKSSSIQTVLGDESAGIEQIDSYDVSNLSQLAERIFK